MQLSTTAKTWTIRGFVIVVVLALCAAGLWYVVGPDRTRTIVAQFASVNGIYPGSSVAVLGMPVGTVEEVKSAGRVVEVRMSIPRDIVLPAEVSAFVMNPSVISDRFVELGPATGRDRPSRTVTSSPSNVVTPRSTGTSCSRTSMCWPPHSVRRAGRSAARWRSPPTRPTGWARR